MKQKIDTLILSGGAMKGVVYCGVLKKLMEIQRDPNSNLEINIKRITSISVGTIFGLTYILGYDDKESEDEVLNKKFLELKDMRITNFLTCFGLDTGKNIIRWIEDLLEKKGYNKDVTFKDLYERTGIHFQVLSTNLHTYKYFTFDYINTPDTLVTRAIRLSISIPFVFTVERYNGQVHVDGGLVSNYPIQLFEKDMSTVLGIKIVSANDQVDKIDDISSYIYNVMRCLIIQKEKHTTLTDIYKEHTIYIEAGPFSEGINFALTTKQKKELIKVGYNATHDFFSSDMN